MEGVPPSSVDKDRAHSGAGEPHIFDLVERSYANQINCAVHLKLVWRWHHGRVRKEDIVRSPYTQVPMIRTQQTLPTSWPSLPGSLLTSSPKSTKQQSEIDGKVLRANYDLSSNIGLWREEKGEYRQNQKACGERVMKHLLNQQEAFAIINGQCS